MMIRTAVATAAVVLIAACGSMTPTMPSYSQAALPAPVQVPAGNKVALETIGVGEITYQCSAKKDMAGSIPLQLVKANPAMGTGAGAMQGVTYIQRVNTQGGGAPAAPCTAANLSAKQIVKYQADYIFYKAM